MKSTHVLTSSHPFFFHTGGITPNYSGLIPQPCFQPHHSMSFHAIVFKSMSPPLNVQPLFPYSHLSNHKLAVKSVKTKILHSHLLAFPVSWASFLFQILWIQVSPLPSCIPPPPTHSAGLSRMTDALAAPRNGSQQTHTDRPLGYLSVFFSLDLPVPFDILTTILLLENLASWDTLLLWFLFYFYSHIFTLVKFSKCCWLTRICSTLYFPLPVDFL